MGQTNLLADLIICTDGCADFFSWLLSWNPLIFILEKEHLQYILKKMTILKVIKTSQEIMTSLCTYILYFSKSCLDV